MKEHILRVKDDGNLFFRADLQRSPKGNIKTALFRWMESHANLGEEYVVVGMLTEVYEAKKQEVLTFEKVVTFEEVEEVVNE